MTTAALATSEGDVGTGVDSEAVILVLDDSSGNIDAGGGANVEGIGVVATLAVAQGVIQGNIVNAQVGHSVDAERLDGSVEDVELVNLGFLQGVSVEELGLGLSTVAALAVPPSRAVAINGVARGTFNDDVASRKGDERSLPLLVSKGCLSLEGDGSAGLESSHIKGSSGGNSNILEDDAGAAGLALDGRSSISESAAGARGHSSIGEANRGQGPEKSE